MIAILNSRSSRIYFNAIKKFNTLERQKIRKAPIVHFAKIKQNIIEAFKKYRDMQKERHG